MNYVHKVMNCTEWDESLWHPNGASSIKKDGIRGFYYPGSQVLFSREFKPIFGMGHIIKELNKYQVPVDMELDIPGMEFNKKSGIIRNHCAADKTDVLGWVIDIPIAGDLKTRLRQRPPESKFVKLINHYTCTSLKSFYGQYDLAIRRGDEGLVWKDLSTPYTNTRKWMRKVPLISIDVPVLDFYEGKGKFAGMLGGVLVPIPAHGTGEILKCRVGTMKGITKADRQEIFNNPEKYRDACCEVEFKEYQPSGKPRQPRFKGWRWDKIC